MLNGSRLTIWKPPSSSALHVGRRDEVVAVDRRRLAAPARAVASSMMRIDDPCRTWPCRPSSRRCALSDELLAAVPLGELERPGAGRVRGGVLPELRRLAGAGDLVGVVLLQRRRAGIEKAGRDIAGMKRAEGLLQLDRHLGGARWPGSRRRMLSARVGSSLVGEAAHDLSASSRRCSRSAARPVKLYQRLKLTQTASALNRCRRGTSRPRAG